MSLDKCSVPMVPTGSIREEGPMKTPFERARVLLDEIAAANSGTEACARIMAFEAAGYARGIEAAARIAELELYNMVSITDLPKRTVDEHAMFAVLTVRSWIAASIRALLAKEPR